MGNVGGSISVNVTSSVTDDQPKTLFLDTTLQEVLYGPTLPLDPNNSESNLSAVWNFEEATGVPPIPGVLGPYIIYSAIFTTAENNIKLAISENPTISPDYGVFILETTKESVFFAEEESPRSRTYAIFTFAEVDGEPKRVYLFPSPITDNPPPVPRNNLISGVIESPQYVFTISTINSDLKAASNKPRHYHK